MVVSIGEFRAFSMSHEHVGQNNDGKRVSFQISLEDVDMVQVGRWDDVADEVARG